MPSRCIARTFGMKRTRSHDRSSVSTNTMFGGARGRPAEGAAGGRSAAAHAAASATRDVASPRRKMPKVLTSPQLARDPLVCMGMRHTHLTSMLVAGAASTTLFAGIAFAATMEGTDHRDRLRGTPDADVIN